MTLDALLIWLSAKGAGSWSQFRGAVEELHVQRQVDSPEGRGASEGSSSDLPVYQEVRFSLQRLGHVEFRGNSQREAWRVVPPSVAFLPGNEARGLLCGARFPALLSQLNEVADVEVQPVEGMPQRIVLCGKSKDVLTKNVRDLGLYVQDGASSAILCALPGVRDTASWRVASAPLTPGWTVQRFLPERFQWISASQEDFWRARKGLFRFAMGHQQFYYLRWRGSTFEVPVQVGKYAVMRRGRGLISYNSERRIFSVPAICRPPLLIERALILCSGLLPFYEGSSHTVEYADVPQEVAQLAAQLLCQEAR